MSERNGASALMLRWLALGAAAGAAATLLLNLFGISGPWHIVALVLILLAVFAMLGTAVVLHRRELEIVRADARVHRGEAELGELQRELTRHTQLEQQLRQAKQAAESAVMAKGEFLATMSHEIRTPLNGIVPMLDLLMHAQLAPDHAELVRTAYTSSQQMLRIVDDILDYSKLEVDKLELESTTFNLRESLEGVFQLLERTAHSKGLRMHLQIEPSVRLPVRGDPVRLRQVLGNLISNAVKFTERGSVSVSVRRIGETPAQHRLHFEIRDTGIGIAPEAQGRLFQAFNQADASTTRLYGGTGLGLAISKRIVELMGGRIGVDSEVGRGATFWFEIPLLKVQGDMPNQADDSGAGSRLLLLSADPRLRLRLSMLLPNWGLRVSSVETTQEALDRLRVAAKQGVPWTYSIVLADLVGMRNTALALHRNLSRQAVYGDLKLVCLYGDDVVSEELRRHVTLLSRQTPDEDLRAALLPAAALAMPGAAIDVASASTGHVPRVSVDPPSTQSESTSMRNARVLLVEDNPVNLMVGQRLLNVLGIQCDTASNGEAALMRMFASRYDVVLMDCQMPVMDGYTATRRWRDTEQEAGDGRHLPIVAMTANAMAGDRQKCLDAGMDDYLPKPVTRSELERCLHRWWHPRIAAERSQDSASSVESAVASGTPETPANGHAAPESTRPFSILAPQSSTSTADASFETNDTNRAPPPVLDDQILDELRSLLGGEVDHLIDVFLEDTPRLVLALENAASGPDLVALRDAAHSLKSSSANLGALSLSEAAKRVETGARTNQLERPAVAVAVIANEFERARRALQAVRNQETGSA